jgi:hypothetical protein
VRRDLLGSAAEAAANARKFIRGKSIGGKKERRVLEGGDLLKLRLPDRPRLSRSERKSLFVKNAALSIGRVALWRKCDKRPLAEVRQESFDKDR